MKLFLTIVLKYLNQLPEALVDGLCQLDAKLAERIEARSIKPNRKRATIA
jgi:hypothetical protein